MLEVLASEECLPESLHMWLSNMKREERGRLDGCSEGTQGAENKVYHLVDDGQKHICLSACSTHERYRQWKKIWFC